MDGGSEAVKGAGSAEAGDAVGGGGFTGVRTRTSLRLGSGGGAVGAEVTS